MNLQVSVAAVPLLVTADVVSMTTSSFPNISDATGNSSDTAPNTRVVTFTLLQTFLGTNVCNNYKM